MIFIYDVWREFWACINHPRVSNFLQLPYRLFYEKTNFPYNWKCINIEIILICFSSVSFLKYSKRLLNLQDPVLVVPFVYVNIQNIKRYQYPLVLMCICIFLSNVTIWFYFSSVKQLIFEFNQCILIVYKLLQTSTK